MVPRSRSIGRKIALAAGGATIVGVVATLATYSLLLHSHPGWAGIVAVTMAVALATGVVALVVRVVERTLVRRMSSLVDAMSKAEDGDFLARVPVEDADEVAKLSEAFNKMLAAITNLRVSMIDQDRELKLASEKLQLQNSLTEKSTQLEQRLAERRLLFDALSTSTSSLSLDDVLTAIALSAGEGLGLREFSILLREEGNDDFLVRAAYGFSDASQVLGLRRHAGEGVSGEVARTGMAIVIGDVSQDERYLSYGGLVERVGSFVCVPARWRGEVIALLDFTRAETNAFSATEVALFSALGEVAAHAIGNARLFERVQRMSMTDELTEVSNRRYLEERLEMEFERAARFTQSLSVLFLDIDHFKLLNDREGHPAGDIILHDVAQILRNTVRKLDTVARYGGEELVVLLPKTDRSEAMVVANKIRERVQTEMAGRPAVAGQPSATLTVSIGVATYPADAADAATLLARSDQALYAAKNAGRNKVVAWGVTSDPPPQATTVN